MSSRTRACESRTSRVRPLVRVITVRPLIVSTVAMAAGFTSTSGPSCEVSVTRFRAIGQAVICLTAHMTASSIFVLARLSSRLLPSPATKLWNARPWSLIAAMLALSASLRTRY